MTEDLQQGTDAWLLARIGFCSASRISDVVAKTKTGYSASRENYKAQLVAEILTGTPQGADLSNNAAVQWGVEKEPEARAHYEVSRGVMVQECGFFIHPTIERSGASPDGLIGEDGLIEIKCPNTATMIGYLLDGKLPAKYKAQCAWQQACTGRKWTDFIAYDPRLNEKNKMLVVRYERDDKYIEELENEVRKFLSEVMEIVYTLSK